MAPPTSRPRGGREEEEGKEEEARGRRRNRPPGTGSARRAGLPDRSTLRGTKAPLEAPATAPAAVRAWETLSD